MMNTRVYTDAERLASIAAAVRSEAAVASIHSEDRQCTRLNDLADLIDELGSELYYRSHLLVEDLSTPPDVAQLLDALRDHPFAGSTTPGAPTVCGRCNLPSDDPIHTPATEPAGLSGAELIAAERHRQVSAEGWTPEHDDHHTSGELVDAAVAYLAEGNPDSGRPWWPWDESYWKPSTDRVRNLAKAGALIAAEIDRLRRGAA